MLDGPWQGVSAFPLTPLSVGGDLDERAVARLVQRSTMAGVDSIGVLGSTGAYPYLSRDIRRRVIEIAVAESGDVPILAGIGHVATTEVLALAEDAQTAGADAVLLAPVSYQPLADDEVVGLYEDVSRELSVPLVVYDNPGTTGVRFSLEMYERVAALPRVAAIKIPPVPADPDDARDRVSAIRRAIPDHVRVGISGDAAGAAGLLAGCDLWFSALAGTLPRPVQRIAAAALDGDATEAVRRSGELHDLWDLFARCGGMRVIAAVADQIGLVEGNVLPRPLLPLDADRQREVAAVLASLPPEDIEAAVGMGGV